MKLCFGKGVWTRKNTEKNQNLSFSDIKKVTILRHAALGDMVLTRIFIIEARKAFPNAVITQSKDLFFDIAATRSDLNF